MDTSIIPAIMKPVPVVKTTDDIRERRGSDLAQQQTIPSMRALSDVFAGDAILKTNAADQKYFTASDKIDLDKVCEAGCRLLKEDTYINGPRIALTDTYVDTAAFLYTMAVLPDGKLIWKPYSTKSEYHYADTLPKGQAIDPSNNRTIKTRGTTTGSSVEEGLQPGMPIRQFFCPTTDSLMEAGVYTRIGAYTGSGYEWGEWVLAGGAKQYIIVTDPEDERIAHPLRNAIYSVHCSISELVLPDANNCALGTTIAILQYPDPDSVERDSWSTLVTYKNTVDGENCETLCTATPNRNSSKTESAHMDGLTPCFYEFEVAPINKKIGGAITRYTWQLNVMADETEFTSGIAEMLGVHIDQGKTDVVDYYTRSIEYPTHDIVLDVSMPVIGRVRGLIKKNAPTLANDFCFSASQVVNTTANFEAVVEGAAPSPLTTYCIKKPSGQYILAENNGHPTTFVTGTQYYILRSTASTTPLFSITGADLTDDEQRTFLNEVPRDALIRVVIHPGALQDHTAIRAGHLVDVTFGIIADPHAGSYIPATDLNTRAFSKGLLDRMIFEGMTVKSLNSDDRQDKTPVATSALIRAYEHIAGMMQQRGLFYGAVNVGSIGGSGRPIGLDNYKSTGVFYITPDLTAGIWPDGTTTDPCYLSVIGDQVCSADLTHETNQFFKTADVVPAKVLSADTVVKSAKYYYTYDSVTKVYTRVTPLATDNPLLNGWYEDKIYYIWDYASQSYVLADTYGILTEFDAHREYFEKTASRSITTGNVVIQMLIQFDDSLNLWIRRYNTEKVKWTSWVLYNNGYPTMTYLSRETNVWDADTIYEKMIGANARFRVLRDQTALFSQVLINLPKPSRCRPGQSLTFEITGKNQSEEFRPTVVAFQIEGSAGVQTYRFSGGQIYKDFDLVTWTTDGTDWFMSTGRMSKFSA